MTQPFGFVPPVAIPAVGGAANAIIPTAGVLTGALAGAKAGAVLGPKGIVVGAIAGALLAPLLFPLPTAPGTLPENEQGLDPGLNPRESPPLGFAPLEGWVPPSLPQSGVGPLSYFRITIRERQSAVVYSRCGAEDIPINSSPAMDQTYSLNYNQIQNVRLTTGTSTGGPSCNPTGYVEKTLLLIEGLASDGTWIRLARQIGRDGDYYNGIGVIGPQVTRSYVIEEVKEGGEIISDPIPENGPTVVPRPRPTPIQFIPFPETEPEPARVPIPDPEPQLPEPETDTEEDDDDIPVTIPPPAPAVPQEPQRQEPGFDPLPGPFQPEPLPTPLPVPGVRPLPQPQPEPGTFPAPSPTPLPNPGPAPLPGPSPQPGTSPIPLPQPIPNPTSPGVAPRPIDSTPTNPGGEIVPRPIPLPTPTNPGLHFPVPGEPGINPGGPRPDMGSIAAEVGRVEQKVAQLLNRPSNPFDIGNLLDLLNSIYQYLLNQKPSTEYTLTGVCECPPDDDTCEEPELKITTPGGDYRDETLARIDAIAEMLQPLKTWKQPICKDKPAQEGKWRTIQFKGDRKLASGRNYLTKTFRYRSKGSQDLEQLVNHWKDFTWQAGPVCVINKGLWWGVPQVWAASADEGRRVIEHAAVEAGISLDKSEWVYSSSKDPRYGLESTMSVRIYRNASEQWYGITNRDTPSDRPLVMEAAPPIRGAANINDK